MGDWVLLLAGSLIFGAALVAAMVAPTPLSMLPLAGGVVALVLSVSGAGNLTERYGMARGLAVGAFFVLAGGAIGYRIAAAVLSHLGGEPRRPTTIPHRAGTDRAVVLLASIDPERYAPRAVARRHERLAVGAGIEVPALAIPLVFLAEKARYRAAGGRSPGVVAARSLASRVGEALSTEGVPVTTSVVSVDETDGLALAVGDHVLNGVGTVAVVVVGPEDSDGVDQAKEALAATRPSHADVRVAFGHAVWNDTRLAARLAERIHAAADEAADAADIGVVLVCQGEPPEWERAHRTARTEENYFNQRVRMLLIESGLEDRTVRIAWLDWQVPDVTEGVRHVAALGRTQIVVAPSTIAMPSLETVVDLHRAVDAARLPDTVTVRVLEPWGDDEGLVAAVARSAAQVLELEGRQVTP